MVGTRELCSALSLGASKDDGRRPAQQSEIFRSPIEQHNLLPPLHLPFSSSLLRNVVSRIEADSCPSAPADCFRPGPDCHHGCGKLSASFRGFRPCSMYPSSNAFGKPTNVLSLQEDDKPFQVRLSDESFETYELDPPSYTLETTKGELKQIYSDMITVR